MNRGEVKENEMRERKSAPIRAMLFGFMVQLMAWLVALAAGLPVAFANHNEDLHEGMTLVGRFDDGGSYRDGSDIAFWENRAVLGNLNPGGFRLLDISDPANPVEVGQLDCGGSQNDVSIFRNLVILSIDGPRASEDCGAPAASTAQILTGTAWEGIRIVSIEDPANPVQVAAVDTPCGSHTHTIIPDTEHRDASGRLAPRLIVYVLSFPLAQQGVDCSSGAHRRIVIVEVPLRDPASARIVNEFDTSPADGCHDVNVLLDRREDRTRMLAGAACITQSQVWDISDPVNPRILSVIVNPLINIHHSAAFNWEGDTLVLGDELGGAAVAPGCVEDEVPLGALWFYDISNPTFPVPQGFFVIPQREGELALPCTAHNYNIVPLKDGRDVLVTAWYTGGTAIVDFTDRANPQQIAFYVPLTEAAPNSWSSYWYNGFVYANNLGTRGVDVFRVDVPEVADAVRLPRLNPQTQERPVPVKD